MKSRLSWVALVCCAPAWAQPSTSEPSVPVEQYHYGMHLDVAEVVSTTTPADKCKPSPVTLIYRDSQGHLKGLEYLVISVDCDSAGG